MMHVWLALKLWAFTMIGMLAVAIAVPGKEIPRAKCDCGCDKGCECSCEHCVAGLWMDYGPAYKLALKTGRPLFVFVEMTVYNYSHVGICCRGKAADFPNFAGVVVA